MRDIDTPLYHFVCVHEKKRVLIRNQDVVVSQCVNIFVKTNRKGE